MYFCEKCNLIMRDTVCENCGKKKLREVQDDDFCFFVSLNANKARYFEENLKLQNIPAASRGVGLDLRTRTSGAFQIFVPYSFFEKAKEIYHLLFEKE